MPLSPDDQQRVNEAIADAQDSTKPLVRDPADSHKLGRFDAICVILNRTIGSGIYVTPAIVLKSINSVGISFLSWSAGTVLAMFVLLLWLEFGLSLPKYDVQSIGLLKPRQEKTGLEWVPRNGREKNYLENIHKAPKLRTICMYGVVFVILGNQSGNAVAFVRYLLKAAGIQGHDAAIRGLAVAAITAICLLHGAWRHGAIVVNNVLASLKVLIFVGVVVTCFAAPAGANFGYGPVHGTTANIKTGEVTSDFDAHASFTSARHDVASYPEFLLFIFYTYSGYEQPVNVLSEVRRPRESFAKSTIASSCLVTVLFVHVNIAYLCAFSFDQKFDSDLDTATLFFAELFGTNVAPRVMSGLMALSILGNIVVMTFTASRVKQEIAKEGIFGKRLSRFFARSTTTPYGYLKARHSRSPPSQQVPPEQAPLAALLLHWIFSMVLIGATSSTILDIAYTTLVSLQSHTIVVFVGFFVAGGLLYLRFVSEERKRWKANAGFRPWGGPTVAIIYSLACAFLIVAAFLPPSVGSPSQKSSTGIDWWIVPTVGLGCLALAYIYYLVFAYAVPRVKKETLFVERHATLVSGEEGKWVQALEAVEAEWIAREAPKGDSTNGNNKNYQEMLAVGHN